MKAKIGLSKATALVASNMIGSGALLTPALLAQFGSLALIGWGITTIGALALALCFCKLSEWVPNSGGPYVYVRHVFGDFIGFQISWGYWFSTWCGSASLIIGALNYLSVFCPSVAECGVISIALGLLMIWIFTAVNMRGISESTTVSLIILFVKIVPLILFALVGIFYFDSSMAFKPVNVDLVKNLSFLSMTQPLLWAFIGLESATVPSGAIENPKKNIPLSTILGVIITASIYIVGAIVIYGVLPESVLLGSKAPYVDAAKYICGEFGEKFMMVTGLVGLVGSLNGWILIHGQVPYSAAKDGLFPSLFLRKNSHGAPIGVLIGSILMSILFIASYSGSLSNQIETLIDLSVFAMVVPYFYCVVAVICIAVKKSSTFSKKENVFIGVITSVAFFYSFFAIYGAGKNIISYGMLAFLSVTVFYAFSNKANK